MQNRCILRLTFFSPIVYYAAAVVLMSFGTLLTRGQFGNEVALAKHRMTTERLDKWQKALSND